MDYKDILNGLLLLTARQNASDLHINVGRKPTIRVDGRLVPIEKQPIITPEIAEGLIGAIISEEEKQRLIKEKSLDFSHAFEDKARFRVNIFFQKSFMAAALRLIPARVKTLEELNLPPIMNDFSRLTQGFILVVGPAGHGKSTTLAALIDNINKNRSENIITIEDPIEYLFSQDRSIISQREVRRDALSFNDALRSVLRQDPDVLMVGEMRDSESIATAMTAAETGHLVLSSLHTNSASQTVNRIIDSFPPEQQGQIASQLASTLVAIISERLLARVDGGRVPAAEIMIANAAVKNLIREKKIHQIDLVIETSLQEGMITLNRSLANLVKKRVVSMEEAEKYSLNSSELKILVDKV